MILGSSVWHWQLGQGHGFKVILLVRLCYYKDVQDTKAAGGVRGTPCNNHLILHPLAL